MVWIVKAISAPSSPIKGISRDKYFPGSGLVSLIKGLLLLPAVEAEFDGVS